MQSPVLVGVDVAKDEVVVACARHSFPVQSVPNTPSGLKKFLKSLPAGSSVAMEATGQYHMALADLAHRLGFVVFVLNPRDMRYYAKGVGMRAKTDRVDALVIARFLLNEGSKLHPYEPPTPAQRQMDQLLKRRAKVVELKGALRQTCSQASALKTEAAKAVADLDALIKKIDRQLEKLSQSIPQRAEHEKQLQTIKGVGPLTAAWLANLFDRVKFKNSDAVVAFTGMDPRSCDSGQKRGRRRLSKRGPAEGRRLLFTAGMAAAKSNMWKPVYEHYRKLGWSTTATILILARKILRIAFSIYKTGLSFDPNLMSKKA
jgi:transposase